MGGGVGGGNGGGGGGAGGLGGGGELRRGGGGKLEGEGSARAFEGPGRIEGGMAREVREGTAAEAGVRPEMAENLDAVCRAWAADSDQAFAVCVVRHGVIVLHRAYGMRDGKPM